MSMLPRRKWLTAAHSSAAGPWRGRPDTPAGEAASTTGARIQHIQLPDPHDPLSTMEVVMADPIRFEIFFDYL